MKISQQAYPALDKLGYALRDLYGDRLSKAVLFGSRARGQARNDSDYDVAVFLKALPDKWNELNQLAKLRLEMLDNSGILLNALPFEIAAYQDRSRLMHEIRRDGVEL